VHPLNQIGVLDSIVEDLSLESVEVDTSLPANLTQYDAVFLESSFLLDSATQFVLASYLDGGGKLYLNRWYEGINPIDSSNPLWLRVGISHTLLTALSVPVDGIYGTNFASNISISFPVDIDGLGYGGPTGNITPVLFGAPYGGGDLVPTLAYISSDTSIRVVMGGDDSPGLPDYYTEFITDVVCNYFNLCSADVKTAPPVVAPENISIVRDSRDNGYSVACDFTTGGEVSVFNSLGINVWSANVHAGENLIELPAALRNGFYFVSVRSGDNVSVARFSIVN